jgi:hypothetical protein
MFAWWSCANVNPGRNANSNSSFLMCKFLSQKDKEMTYRFGGFLIIGIFWPIDQLTNMTS